MSGYADRTQGFKGIHDPIYVRAIVVDDGTTQAALVAWELIFVPDAVWAEVSPRIAAETGIRPENLILAAVHDHGAPIRAGDYAKKVEDAAIEAIRLAKSRLQPAKFGYGTGTAYVNVNRRELTPSQGWWLGYNEKGASDKTVHVLRFDDLAGKPIAFLVNYAVHVVVMGPDNYQITGDLAGATSRFVEQHYAGKDNPRRRRRRACASPPDEKKRRRRGRLDQRRGRRPESRLDGQRRRFLPWPTRSAKSSARRSCASRAPSRLRPRRRIRGAQQVVTCPGRKVEDGPRPRTDYKFTDADPGQHPPRPAHHRRRRAWRESRAKSSIRSISTCASSRPSPRTIMITHANGSSGYIPDDTGFEQIGYEVTTSRLKPGCAENAIVNGIIELMRGK